MTFTRSINSHVCTILRECQTIHLIVSPLHRQFALWTNIILAHIWRMIWLKDGEIHHYMQIVCQYWSGKTKSRDGHHSAFFNILQCLQIYFTHDKILEILSKASSRRRLYIASCTSSSFCNFSVPCKTQCSVTLFASWKIHVYQCLILSA